MLKNALLVLTLAASLHPSIVFAHPGRTAGDGCHYCRTNCDDWGVPWGQRHCHYSPDAGKDLAKAPLEKKYGRQKTNQASMKKYNYTAQRNKTVPLKP